MKYFFCLTISFIFCFNGQSQNLSNKIIPAEVYQEVAQALSFFPELDDVHITFKFKKHLKNRVMQAQPRIKTFFKSRDKRHYKIVMSHNLQMSDTTMTLNELPSDILVGWFAHELGHVMDYKDRTGLNLVGFAVKYLTSVPFLKRSEKKADLLAADRGLGKHLIKTKRFILFKSKFSRAYKAKIKDLYPSPEEITAMVGENDIDED